MTIDTNTLIEQREIEVAQYEANIAMYKVMLETLPSEWPEHLAHFKNMTDHHSAIALIEDLDDVQLVSELWHHDICQARVRSEMVELQKSKGVLAYLKSII